MSKITEQKVIRVCEEMGLEIPNKFEGSQNNQKIAKKSLELCKEWAIMNIVLVNNSSIKEVKKLCKSHVKKNLEKDDAIKGIIFTIILGVIIKLIVDWIVNNFIYNLKKE